ncbi:hypothetical protein EYF80_018258 [Liparis tanakae]|uniref:Secreted protein n=1 Tax=Liparis tanakae TaxID=230148 RepID=A0A4Z2I2U6_9TELE|nr:hypothetical protein EYF80_018258 [Liparis tanakae]
MVVRRRRRMRKTCRSALPILTLFSALPLTKAQPRIKMLTQMIPDSIHPQFRLFSFPTPAEGVVESGSHALSTPPGALVLLDRSPPATGSTVTPLECTVASLDTGDALRH